MSRLSLVALSLLCYFSIQPNTFAAERVFRLVSQNNPGFGLKVYSYPVSSFQLDADTFSVYTTEETDSKFSVVIEANKQSVKMIDELRSEMANLRQNLKDLSDINDALEKRINDLEAEESTSPSN